MYFYICKRRLFYSLLFFIFTISVICQLISYKITKPKLNIELELLKINNIFLQNYYSSSEDHITKHKRFSLLSINNCQLFLSLYFFARSTLYGVLLILALTTSVICFL